MVVGAQHLKLSSLPPRSFFAKNYPEDVFRKMGGAKGRIVGAGAVFFLKKRSETEMRTLQVDCPDQCGHFLWHEGVKGCRRCAGRVPRFISGGIIKFYPLPIYNPLQCRSPSENKYAM